MKGKLVAIPTDPKVDKHVIIADLFNEAIYNNRN